LGDLYQALKYYLDALTIRDKLRDNKAKFSSYHNIANVYKYRAEFKTALEYAFKALAVAFELKEKFKEVYSREIIGLIYLDIGKFDSAYRYFLATKALTQEMGDSLRMASALLQIARCYQKFGKRDSSALILEQVVEIAKSKMYPELYCEALTNLAAQYISEQGNRKAVQKAIPLLEQALYLAQKNRYFEAHREALGLLSAAFEQLRDYQKALRYFKEYQVLSDTIYNKDKALEMGKLHGKYEILKLIEEEKRTQTELERQKKIELNRKNSLQYTGIFLFCVLLSIVAVLLWRVRTNTRLTEVLIFLAFIVVVEFVILLIDPYLLEFTGGRPIFSLLGNTVLAIVLVPLHQFIESKISHQSKSLKG
jgi:tetratricopeptide (TPR) repeat protein